MLIGISLPVLALGLRAAFALKPKDFDYILQIYAGYRYGY